MKTAAIVLVVLSAAMHAARNYFTKKATDKQAFVWWYEWVGLLFFTPLFAIYFPSASFSGPYFWAFIVLCGVLHFVYWVFLTRSLEAGDLSLVYPIMRSSPALVLLFSVIVLKEDVSLKGATGILLVALGSYTINLQRLSWDHLLRPLLSVSRDRAIRFAVLTLFSVAAYSIADKAAVEHIHPVIFAYLYPWLSLALYSGYLGRQKTWREIKGEWLANRKVILVCGVLAVFGYFLILVAFTIDRVSYIVGLRQVSIVFAVALGGFGLKEKHRTIRFLSAGIIFGGSLLIASG